MNVYDKCPVLESEHFILRKTDKSDVAQLLAVYSDNKAVNNMNSDNCNGDNFHYQTIKRMEQAVDFWNYSYSNRFFVRWSIKDKNSSEVVGTVELFHRDSEDFYTDCGLLRIDLRYEYEKEDKLVELLELIVDNAYELFNCSMLATKAVNSERVNALLWTGFEKSDEPLLGHDKTAYGNYYFRKNNL